MAGYVHTMCSSVRHSSDKDGGSLVFSVALATVSAVVFRSELVSKVYSVVFGS